LLLRVAVYWVIPFNALTPFVGQQKGIRAVKNLLQTSFSL